MKYTLARAKEDHRIGYLRSYKIERVPLGACWRLLLGDGMAQRPLADAREGNQRVFRSLDSVIDCLTAIGFEVNVLS